MTTTPRILVIDDDLMSCKVAKAMLNRLGYDDVHHVADGSAAQSLMQVQSFDLVLLDWAMPVMNGAETISLIRSGARGPHHTSIPVIVATADLTRCSKEICLQTGVTDYLTKPIDLGALSAMVRIHLER